MTGPEMLGRLDAAQRQVVQLDMELARLRAQPAALADAVTGLLAAIHAVLPEADGTQPVTGVDMVRTLTDAVLRRGVDEVTLTGAASLLRDAIPAAVRS